MALSPGACLGELALAPGWRRTATVAALGAAELLALPAADYHRLLVRCSHPPLHHTRSIPSRLELPSTVSMLPRRLYCHAYHGLIVHLLMFWAPDALFACASDCTTCNCMAALQVPYTL